MNTFGDILRLTTFGESHGVAIGGVLDGFPAGIDVDVEFIQSELNRRRPGQSALTTARAEGDRVEILSGVFEGKSTGTPIAFEVRNENQRSGDYSELKDIFRPSHADYTYQMKYGIRDYAGGGRASARTTIAQVAGGAFAKLLLRKLGVRVYAYTSLVGDIALNLPYQSLDLEAIDSNAVRCPDAQVAERMAQEILKVKGEGDTIGGIISCVIKGCPVGLGEPQFGKLHAKLAGAMLSINAVKGFDYGCGFDGVSKRGSELNDIFERRADGSVGTRTNNSGGVQGGISNGEDIYFRVAFKPVPTLLMDQESVNTEGCPVTYKARGRHDACVLPRAVPIVDAMAALVVADAYLQGKASGRLIDK
ncbi:MAG: chorismate synthase [Paludibacteraceae bacterium]|nr:chorismate synthase [Paludibacteraceae bacterium]